MESKYVLCIACVPYDDSDDSNFGRFGGDDCLRDGLYDDEEVFMAKFVSGGAITKLDRKSVV